MVQGRKCVTVTRRFWVQSQLERMNYYLPIFSFLRSGSKALSSPAQRNASESNLTIVPFAYPAVSGIQCEANKKELCTIFIHF